MSTTGDERPVATVALAINCPGLLDLAEISSRYAQLTGLPAGFAFTAIVVLLTPTQIDERKKAADPGKATDETGVLPCAVEPCRRHRLLGGHGPRPQRRPPSPVPPPSPDQGQGSRPEISLLRVLDIATWVTGRNGARPR